MRSSPWVGKMLPMRSGGDDEPLRRAHLIGEARRAQRDREFLGAHPVAPRRIALFTAAVVEAMQLRLKLRRCQAQTCVELKRRCVHLRRQRPAPPLELLRHQAIEVDDVAYDHQRRDAGDEEDQALQTKSSAAGARRL